jgi:hypothetical protein
MCVQLLYTSSVREREMCVQLLYTSSVKEIFVSDRDRNVCTVIVYNERDLPCHSDYYREFQQLILLLNRLFSKHILVLF